MNKIKIKDKYFELYINRSQIQKEIAQIAEKLNKNMEGKNPLFIVVLNGSFMFASDLLKQLTFNCEISFIKLASYQGTTSTETINTLIGLTENIKNRNIVIIEDIIDTGYTIQGILSELNKKEPAQITVCTLFFKPDAYKINQNIDYIGIEIPNDFVVGYGMDYNGYGRQFPDLYKIVS